MLRNVTSMEQLLEGTLPLALAVDTESAVLVLVAQDATFGHMVDVAYNPLTQEN